jgi:hypothetical protein
MLINQVFEFDKLQEGIEYLGKGAHFGKIVVHI